MTPTTFHDTRVKRSEIGYPFGACVPHGHAMLNRRVGATMAKVIMIQGTMSNAGKSFIAAGLCRVFKQDGYRVAPFKSQNMALNSYITEEGLEMGRAQVVQAEAAGIKPSVSMNPILLKPTNDNSSQVIVNGEIRGNMNARDYYAYKPGLIPDILSAFHSLEEKADIIVIEGAGSPAEINLKEDDIVNMGMAEMVDAPVLLVGDIDRGGVFAQLLGTILLLEEQEKDRIKGLVINKFRGDKAILDPGIAMLEARAKIPVTGVVPYRNLSLDEEDSLTERFQKKEVSAIDLAVLRYPRISNFTDFHVFEQMKGVSVRYVTSPTELKDPDVLFLPGSKNTMGDLRWLRESGLEAAVKKKVDQAVIFGICGGYQMLGTEIADPDSTEEGGSIRGMELLPVKTVLKKEKTRRQTEGIIRESEGILNALAGMRCAGYEIHMGDTFCSPGQKPNPVLLVGDSRDGMQEKDIYGTYLHGFFDEGDIAAKFVQALANKKGLSPDRKGSKDYRQFKETQYDLLADTMRRYMDMDAVYEMLREAREQ